MVFTGYYDSLGNPINGGDILFTLTDPAAEVCWDEDLNMWVIETYHATLALSDNLIQSKVIGINTSIIYN